MKQDDEKARNNRIDKLIAMLRGNGTRRKSKSLEESQSDENWFKKDQTEEDYQKEQAAWLKRVAEKKKSRL